MTKAYQGKYDSCEYAQVCSWKLHAFVLYNIETHRLCVFTVPVDYQKLMWLSAYLKSIRAFIY